MAQSITLLGEDPWASALPPADATPEVSFSDRLKTFLASLAPAVTVSPSVPTPAPAPAPVPVSSSPFSPRNAVIGATLVLAGYVVYSLLSPRKKGQPIPAAAQVVAGLFGYKPRRRRR